MQSCTCHMTSFFSLVHPEILNIYIIYSSVILQRVYESIVNACKLVSGSVMEQKLWADSGRFQQRVLLPCGETTSCRVEKRQQSNTQWWVRNIRRRSDRCGPQEQNLPGWNQQSKRCGAMRSVLRKLKGTVSENAPL